MDDTVVLVLFVAALAVVIYFLFASFVYGAGYQPTPRDVVERMLELASVGPSDTLYDLGAGTGAIVFRAARQRGATAVGVEVEPLRVLVLRLRRALGGPRDRVRVVWGDFDHLDLAPATVVAVFLWPPVMERLKARFENELAAGSRVVSHWHPVAGWRPDAVDRRLRVYLYRMPPTRAAMVNRDNGPIAPPP